jgi:hypothetical protein
LDALGLGATEQTILTNHAIEKFVGKNLNTSLASMRLQELNPLLTFGNQNVKVENADGTTTDFSKEALISAMQNKTSLTLDIAGKKYILDAVGTPKFAYFAQCVNHMLLLDDIRISLREEGKGAQYEVSLANSSLYRENISDGVQETTVNTSQNNFGIAAGIRTNGGEKEEKITDDPTSNP